MSTRESDLPLPERLRFWATEYDIPAGLVEQAAAELERLMATPRVLSAEEFLHLAMMGRSPDGTLVLGPGAAERMLAEARRLDIIKGP